MSDTPTSKPQQQQQPEPPPAIIPIASPSGMLIGSNVVNTPRSASSSRLSPRQSPRQSPRPIKSPAVSISSLRRQNSATSMKSLTRFPVVPKLDSSGGTSATTTVTGIAPASSSTPSATTESTHSSTFKENVETERNLQTDPIEDALKIQGVLPIPMDSKSCPLFCCFYAEFDNIVGPKICFQSPPNFMEKDISTPTEHIHRLLEE
eukprot:CAMPEP_0195302384 /NCGR_PEP_ID=MMETSP0707-20130614/30972_1 /TAXON_ID=33640 /ORGANISM="Asterionellopsis glacialis, Strain CCMP134" /LENGTH=205 /DNA_ID=CAMNT_0040365619 /DNA_START=49 /DNA_END=663 /DNA_ORIENTATION=-